MRPDLPQTFAALAPLVSGVAHDDAFGEGLVRLFRALVVFDHVVVFGYRGDARPLDLFSTFDPRDYVVFVAKYQEGPYLLDPFFRAASEPRPGFWRMRDLAPDRFFSSEYYRSYYVETQLAEEVGFFVPLAGGASVVVSLMRRRASGAFPARALALLKSLEPLVAALVTERWGALASRFDGGASRRSGPDATPAAASPSSVWRDLNLTSREAAVVELVLQGHSSESIARRLDVATGTVKVHRRNVYRKLGISSQTQLLSIYLGKVAGRS